jgi:hypothetical protein
MERRGPFTADDQSGAEPWIEQIEQLLSDGLDCSDRDRSAVSNDPNRTSAPQRRNRIADSSRRRHVSISQISGT